MLSRWLRISRWPLVVVLFAVISFAHADAIEANTGGAGHTLVLDGLGKGAALLAGPWRFHVGDDPAWASPDFDDSNWEQLTANKPWGLQGHDSYSGYAWYRRRISITPAPGTSPDIALLIPAAGAVYQLFWNGVEVGHLGSMPPHLVEMTGGPAQTFGLGPIRHGVLAVRFWGHPPASNADGSGGGFYATPYLGSPEAIAAGKATLDYQWLRNRQFGFGLTSLYTLVAVLSLIGWLRDRKQWLLFWMAVFAFTPLAELFFRGLHISYNALTLNFAVQTEIQVREVAQWFLLLWLLQLHDNRRLVKFARVAGIFTFASGVCDGITGLLYPTVLSDRGFQIFDVAFTAPLLVAEIFPAVLVTIAFVRRKRLDPARWAVAFLAFLGATIYAVSNISVQGVRYTHWTLASRLGAPLLVLNGNPLNLLTIVRTLLFVAIVFAVIRYSIAERRRQAGFEQEIQNARELQQVLVPETLPALPGFTLTSAYRPAQEVGGDFFQIIPLDGATADRTMGEEGSSQAGSTLVILGDVSGKGLRAAMAVSLIVGSIRTLAETTASPAAILAGLNRRLIGRLQGGFATAIALRIDRDGSCTIACAGHPAPFVNEKEMSLPAALPLGLTPGAVYEETRLELVDRDQLALYTDGLLEARSESGKLYSFDRLKSLFATHPTAEEAAQAAVNFGQDDDITVLTLTRVPEAIETAA